MAGGGSVGDVGRHSAAAVPARPAQRPPSDPASAQAAAAASLRKPRREKSTVPQPSRPPTVPPGPPAALPARRGPRRTLGARRRTGRSPASSPRSGTSSVRPGDGWLEDVVAPDGESMTCILVSVRDAQDDRVPPVHHDRPGEPAVLFEVAFPQHDHGNPELADHRCRLLGRPGGVDRSRPHEARATEAEPQRQAVSLHHEEGDQALDIGGHADTRVQVQDVPARVHADRQGVGVASPSPKRAVRYRMTTRTDRGEISTTTPRADPHQEG